MFIQLDSNCSQHNLTILNSQRRRAAVNEASRVQYNMIGCGDAADRAQYKNSYVDRLRNRA